MLLKMPFPDKFKLIILMERFSDQNIGFTVLNSFKITHYNFLQVTKSNLIVIMINHLYFYYIAEYSSFKYFIFPLNYPKILINKVSSLAFQRQ